MKHVAALAAIALAMGLSACGGTSSSPVVTNPGNGMWTATMLSASGQQLGSFTFNMMQNSTTLTGSNMNFANMGSLGPCFGAGAVMNGQMGAGMMNGGNMNMNMSWTPPGSTKPNTLVMQGTMSMGMSSGNGNFTLTGQNPGCNSQNGTFTLSRMM